MSRHMLETKFMISGPKSEGYNKYLCSTHTVYHWGVVMKKKRNNVSA